MTDVLLWANIIACPLGALVLLWRRSYLLATLLLVAALCLLAGLNYVELLSLQQSELILKWRVSAIVLEAVSVFCLYFYTKTVFRDNSEIYKGWGFWLSVVIALALLVFIPTQAIDSLIFSPDFADEQIIYLTKTGFAVYLLLMVYLVFGLVQLERTLAGLHQLQRWGVKLEVIGSGLLLAAYAFYFSQSLLYRSLNMNYLGLRSCAVLLAVVLLCYARLQRQHAARLALSRGIAHRSFVLLIVGGYLILLGAVGEGLRYLNLANARLIFYLLLLVSSLGLAVVFLSERLRRKLKVTLHKNFYQSKYDYREFWEKFARNTGEQYSSAGIQTAILDLFCETLAAKWAAFYLYNPDTRVFEQSVAFNVRRDWRPFALEDPLMSALQKKDWVINLRENASDFTDSLLGSFKDIETFLVIPLSFDDELVGFILLGEQIHPETLTYEDYDLLRMLAQQSIATVQGLRLSEQLSIARELATVGKISTFVLHDLKNQVSGLSLMLDNAREYISDPDFQQDMLETVESTVNKMKNLIARLKNVKDKPNLVIAKVDMKKLIGEAIETAGGTIEFAGETLELAVDEEEIYKVVLNLLINALEATKNGAPIEIVCEQQEGSAVVRVTDSGCGMSSEFIAEKLFKPFETTKPHGFGIGLYQCRQIVESHGGSISVESTVGQGTTFTLSLPLPS